MRHMLVFALVVLLAVLPAIALAEGGEQVSAVDEKDDEGFEWSEELDHFMPTTQYEPGRGKTMLIATTFGVVTGMVVGGLLLIFYQNPDADKNFEPVFITTGICGFGGGLALGMTLPAGATREDSAAGLRLDDPTSFHVQAPAVGLVDENTLLGKQRLWRANLFRFSF